MNWTSYFIALGLPSILTLLTFILAVIFIQSNFLKRLFLWCFSVVLVFSVVWVLVGIIVAVMQTLGD
ncbi:hypothetical protein [Mannheimia pernigra]|uniref:hypothetical protein n=1 Tax=Mannheimia pernigra TaxID=111844 RepID=UPI00159F3C4A|nr:hypothetical protein [Mannheimia pernigra]QLB44393.1 hypothetical protein HV561_06340 [Mannheimia pernigra]QLB44456.1 hypothetical protein HV561_06715 [Mannheimia pernigra]